MNDLLVDIGNTRLKWRLQVQGRAVGSGHLPIAALSLDELQNKLPANVERVVWASVASASTSDLLASWAHSCGVKALQVTTQAQWRDLVNGYMDPAQMGVDRWLAVVAAWNIAQTALCVVDCGSATTMDYVAANGQHLGGYIVPGSRLMAQSLLRDTAQIAFSGAVTDSVALGQDTQQAVLAGCGQMALYGVAGFVAQARIDGYQILVCGGDGLALAQSTGFNYYPELVLDGLALLVE